MISLNCSSKLTDSTIKDHIKDNEGSLKTFETTRSLVLPLPGPWVGYCSRVLLVPVPCPCGRLPVTY